MSKKPKGPLLTETEYLLFLLLWNVGRLVPLKIAYFLADVGCWILCTFDFRHWRRTLRHLVHAGLFATEEEAKPFARKSVRCNCGMFAEIVKADQCFSMEKVSVGGDPDTIRDLIDPATKKYPNHIVLGAHFGNWEIAGRIYTELTGNTLCSIMRPFENRKIGEKILSHRDCRNHELISKDRGAGPLLRALLSGKNISVIADQHASHTEGVEVTFFGHPARTHKTPALLHLKTGIPICPAVTLRLPGEDFHFQEIFGKMICYTPTGDKEADVKAVTQMCNDELERLIRMHPEQWMWSARRWLDADGRNR